MELLWAARWLMRGALIGPPRAQRLFATGYQRKDPITGPRLRRKIRSKAFVARARGVYQRTTGAVLAPMSAFLILLGIETVALRMERHTENARQVAHFLRADHRVAWVDYSGFPDSPYYGLTGKYLGGRAASLFTFGVIGNVQAAKAFYDSLKLVKRLVNIGDTRTLCCHPASTTHRQMTSEEQLRAGVSPETIRLSVGIEHAQDIIEDLDQALSVASPATSRVVLA